jgi:hypothetical protein
MTRLVEQGTTLTWGLGPSSDPGSGVIPLLLLLLLLLLLVVLLGVAPPDSGGGGGTGGLTRLCAPWAWELASSVPPAALWRFWRGSETSDPSARRSLRRLSSSDPLELPGAEALLVAPLPLSKGLGATAGLAMGATSPG